MSAQSNDSQLSRCWQEQQNTKLIKTDLDFDQDQQKSNY